MAVITIIGSGMMGSALAFPARENGHTVRLCGTHLDREIIDICRRTGRHPKFTRDFPAGVEYYQIEELEKALDGADLVIGGVSSFGVDWFSEAVLPLIPETTPILTVTKGLIHDGNGRLLSYPAYWQSKSERKLCLNAVGGPCTSYELVAHDQTEVTFCGEDPEILRRIRSYMETDYYHVSISTDVTGIESAVALKNGYALGIALTIGLNQAKFGRDSELHFNSQAAVFGQSVREMKKLLAYQGADTPENLAVGLGDLYVTVYGGRTRLVGILLGRGLSIEEALAELQGVTLESLVVSRRVAEAVRVAAGNETLSLADFPLLCHIDGILTNHASPELPWDSFRSETV
ncbi:MAG: glycerol-3-phosphate dehydrogenase [Ruminococcus sp.]|nr:glycerol-3-phosphate dehydrogenase [Candidatus Apopatosoma intestinale]